MGEAAALDDVREQQTAECAAESLRRFAGGRHWPTIYADPPWQFANKTGKVGPEHRRLFRYRTMTNEEIMALPVGDLRSSPKLSGNWLWVMRPS